MSAQLRQTAYDRQLMDPSDSEARVPRARARSSRQNFAKRCALSCAPSYPRPSLLIRDRAALEWTNLGAIPLADADWAPADRRDPAKSAPNGPGELGP